ncbi:MAG: hypothetical protein A3H93_08000 [Rhodocyclales bacterium RIFCSPLOWO2_02_FULL_63_24]|nr:MAG: hypothetical protein A3H93_08000 [Rhodocyclales bacterium RIFCSPLOWO2_02_FULL_63_24]
MKTDELPDIVFLMASALVVMTRFIQTGCPRQGALVRRQLGFLQSYPDHLMPPPLKAAVRRLHGDWELMLLGTPQGNAATPSTLQ